MKRKSIADYALATAKTKWVTTEDPRDAEILHLRAQVAALRSELNIVEERIPALVNVLDGGGNDVSVESWTIIRARIRDVLKEHPDANS